ncbi:hypothetical protein NQ318_004228 [Aromia moschata]|uniref:Uncharacterized protein n=1 Tax=Aromia moschata TaxID=1265417 RepID=A0AAV8Y591_9CUCU|nr:hypothetical protein NQ318_004228 [Aromia moschata]
MFDNVNSRIFPTLKSNDVADRVVEALRREETNVMIPGSFRLAMWLKVIMPWPITSLSLRNLVPDAAPHSPQVVQITEKEEEISSDIDNKNKSSSLSSSVTKLNQRLVATGKNL